MTLLNNLKNFKNSKLKSYVQLMTDDNVSL